MLPLSMWRSILNYSDGKNFDWSLEALRHFWTFITVKQETLNGFAFAGQTGLWSLIPHCFLSILEIEAVLH